MKEWKNKPISCTCEVLISYGKFCDKPTEAAYPADGGGWMALCMMHSLKHKEATPVVVLINDGQTFA